MAQPSFDAFFWSLTQQESGGNYSAIGPATKYGHAYGRYQVLETNIPRWTKQYYGRSLTPQQFLNNHAAQDAVARGVLKGYYSKYGAAGAAAMWYSGQPNPNKTYGSPPVKTYVSSVINRAYSYSGQSVPGGGGATGGGPVKVALDKDELAASYGLTSALINSSKELKSLFNKAVSGGWSAAKFGAQLKNTKWWKSQSSTLRKYVTAKYTDPATWKQQQSAALYAMNQLAVTVGLGNQIKGGKGSKLLLKAVYNKTALGWTDARLKDWLGLQVSMHGQHMWGDAGEALDKLHEVAYLNGMSYSDSWYKSKVQGIVGGKSTMEDIEAKIRGEAGAKYYAYANQIQAGQNVLDLAAPYIKTVSQLLELPETDVDLFNKHIAHAMTQKVGKGEQPGTQMPLWQFENEVRADPLWRKTNNARESMMTVAHQVAKDFGLVF